jgi:hypothetical protein
MKIMIMTQEKDYPDSTHRGVALACPVKEAPWDSKVHLMNIDGSLGSLTFQVQVRHKLIG